MADVELLKLTYLKFSDPLIGTGQLSLHLEREGGRERERVGRKERGGLRV